MSESKHTPGPWAVVGAAHQATEVGAMMGTPDCIIVADTALLHGMPTSRQLADAHLIAAAPEMLAALEAIVDAYGVGADADVFVRHIEDFIKDGMAAVAKARGEAQP